MKITVTEYLLKEMVIEGADIRTIKDEADKYVEEGWKIGTIFRLANNSGFGIELTKQEVIQK